MTTTQHDTSTPTPGEGDLTALEMARNCLAAVRAAAAYQASDDPEKQLLAHSRRVSATEAGEGESA